MELFLKNTCSTPSFSKETPFSNTYDWIWFPVFKLRVFGNAADYWAHWAVTVRSWRPDMNLWKEKKADRPLIPVSHLCLHNPVLHPLSQSPRLFYQKQGAEEMVWHLKSRETCACSHLQPYIIVISALGPCEGEGSGCLFHTRAVFTPAAQIQLMWDCSEAEDTRCNYQDPSQLAYCLYIPINI